MERRNFLKKTAIATGAAAVALAEAPNVIAQQRFQWRMSTTWTPALDVLQGAAQKMAKITMSVSVTVRPGDSYSSPTWMSSKKPRESVIGSVRIARGRRPGSC